MNQTTDLEKTIISLDGPIVIFGAGGFIGANLIKKILEYREDCYGVTHQNYTPWRLKEINQKNILHCDIIERNQVFELFAKFRFRTIFVLSAYGAYARQANSQLIYHTNVIGLLNIVEAASAHEVSALVHSGSSSEYGSNCAGPEETDDLAPNSHYSASKISAWYMLKYFAKTNNFPAVNLRYYSIYGSYEESDRFIPALLIHAKNKKFPPLVSPTISRDFVYIDDAIEAALLAAENINNCRGESINIASGIKTTIEDAVNLAKELFKIPETPVWSGMKNRRWDLRDWYGNPSKAHNLLGWKAKTSLKEGLLKTYAWLNSAEFYPEVRTLTKIEKVPRLSAVIACYKDNQAIPIMHQRLRETFLKLKVDFEIIFVNDCSPDNTDEVLSKITAQDSHVIAIEHSRNFGSQNAFISGMKISTGDAIIVLDGDLQDPPELISEFYHKWVEGFEVVYGRRIKRETPFFPGLCYKAFYRIFRKFSYVPMPLDAGDFSLMDRKVVNQLLSLPETDQFIRGLRAWVGFKQTGVDYIRPERMFGTTTNNWRKNFWWARKAIFNFSFLPLDFLTYSGIILTIIAFIMLVLQVIAKFIWPDVPHGITTIIVLILFFGGVQILSMSILGEYLGKIFEETKKRPKYICKSIRHGGKHFASAKELEEFIKKKSSIISEN